MEPGLSEAVNGTKAKADEEIAKTCSELDVVVPRIIMC